MPVKVRRFISLLSAQPILFFCLAWYGQLLLSPLALLLLFLCLCLFRTSALFFPVLLGIAVGQFDLSLLDSSKISEEELSKEPLYVVAHLREEPRRFRSGMVLLKLRLLGEQSGRLAECWSEDLPWRNASKLEDGDIAYFSLSWKRRRCYIRHASEAVTRWLRPFPEIRHYLTSLLRSSELSVSGFLPTMILGARDQLSDRFRFRFQDLGLMHVLVISGFHLGLAVWLANLLAKLSLSGMVSKALLLRVDRHRRVLIFLFALLMLLVCYRGQSLFRAFGIVTIFSCGHFLSRPQSLLNCLCLSTFLLILASPEQSSSYSALLSLSAYLLIVILLELPSKLLTAFLLAAFMALSSALMFSKFCALALLFSPVLSLPLAALGTLGGWFGLTLQLLELDPSGHILEFLAEVLSWIAFRLEELALLYPCSRLTEGEENVAAVVFLSSFVGLFAWRARVYSRLRGLD